VPNFICPNCKERSVDIDRKEGMFDEAVACHHCGFGFLFELMDDYYPAPTTGLVTCDQEGRILAIGRGVFELSGWREADVLGADVIAAFGLEGFEEEKNPVKLSLEWGVRRLNEQLQLRTRGGPGQAGGRGLLPRARRRRRAARRADARARLGSPRRPPAPGDGARHEPPQRLMAPTIERSSNCERSWLSALRDRSARSRATDWTGSCHGAFRRRFRGEPSS
jgi:hypothetical protein